MSHLKGLNCSETTNLRGASARAESRINGVDVKGQVDRARANLGEEKKPELKTQNGWQKGQQKDWIVRG